MKIRPGKLLQRQKELLALFRNRKGEPTDKQCRIESCTFESSASETIDDEHDFLKKDAEIQENRHFTYPVFIPGKRTAHRSCILLLHGLNERSWDKYLSWAEYLALNTGKPVILFPIAFHINRSPSAWSDPRAMSVLIEKRRQESGSPGSLCFANAALSNRLTEDPYRFYHSGRQTVNDITNLALQIKSGRHPFFSEETVIDIMGYSIGSFLAEIILMANPKELFSSSRLFIFCGGSIFRHMYGESRYIMDKAAYEKLLNYYCNEWKTGMDNEKGKPADLLHQAFNSMIAPDLYRERRETFFNTWKDRIAGISLLKDKVMPFSGVEACMGSQLARKCFDVMDFPFPYSHETPFPSKGNIDGRAIDSAFQSVFGKGIAFLG